MRESDRTACNARPGWSIALAGGGLTLAVLVVYYNCRAVPFLFDDTQSITGNPSILRFWSAFSPPASLPVGGRPMVNLSYALNDALGGWNVSGYHAFNVLVHAAAALVLFGIARRTLLQPVMGQRFRTDATWLALAIAALWAVHPVQTEAVTYITQRAESLMGLFYLLTLYCFIRGAETEAKSSMGVPPMSVGEHGLEARATSNIRHFRLFSVLSCLLGTATKEVMVSAPLIVLLYDRIFVAGSFRETWHRRSRYYIGLAASWLLLAGLMTGLGMRGAGFGLGVTPWTYALTSCRSVVLYLKLAFWPHPLVFDYGPLFFLHRATAAAPYALVLAVLLACAVVALIRRPQIGFAGAWFFVILAPTSSVIPLAAQPTAEHRLYLPLAAVAALVVIGLHAWIGRLSKVVIAAIVLGLGWITVHRNEDYRSALGICADTVAKAPGNPRAQCNLGMVLTQIPGRLPDAIAHYEQALRIKPDYAPAQNDAATAYALAGRIDEAIAHLEIALKLDPSLPGARDKLARLRAMRN